MKLHKMVLVLALVALLPGVMAAPAAAEGRKTPVSGWIMNQENPDWLPLNWNERVLGNGLSKIDCWTYDIVHNDTDARLDGYEVFHYFAITDWTTGDGHAWGSLEIVTADGRWEGTFNGKMVGYNHFYQVTLVGKDAYQGLVAKLDYVGWQDGGCFSCPWQVTGYIIETGN